MPGCSLFSLDSAFGPVLTKKIALLHAVHLSARDLAKNALNWSAIVLTREHDSRLFLRCATKGRCSDGRKFGKGCHVNGWEPRSWGCSETALFDAGNFQEIAATESATFGERLRRFLGSSETIGEYGSRSLTGISGNGLPQGFTKL